MLNMVYDSELGDIYKDYDIVIMPVKNKINAGFKIGAKKELFQSIHKQVPKIEKLAAVSYLFSKKINFVHENEILGRRYMRVNIPITINGTKFYFADFYSDGIYVYELASYRYADVLRHFLKRNEKCGKSILLYTTNNIMSYRSQLSLERTISIVKDEINNDKTKVSMLINYVSRGDREWINDKIMGRY
jgi:cytochrome c biogenesis protein ResB